MSLHLSSHSLKNTFSFYMHTYLFVDMFALLDAFIHIYIYIDTLIGLTYWNHYHMHISKLRILNISLRN